jgi:hypothetical protein
MAPRAAGVCLGNRNAAICWSYHPPASIPVETGPALNNSFKAIEIASPEIHIHDKT